MSMSDCPSCWDTPCTCGKSYEGSTSGYLRSQIRMLERQLASALKREEQERLDKVVGKPTVRRLALSRRSD